MIIYLKIKKIVIVFQKWQRELKKGVFSQLTTGSSSSKNYATVFNSIGKKKDFKGILLV